MKQQPCPHCNGTILVRDEDQIVRCLMCSRVQGEVLLQNRPLPLVRHEKGRLH